VSAASAPATKVKVDGEIDVLMASCCTHTPAIDSSNVHEKTMLLEFDEDPLHEGMYALAAAKS